ncbi:fructose-bisphosphatase class II [Thermus scotoductus]|jgi:fructose-1,6-bisphosphatase II|uniref:Fructose-1,6-bisphosphatase n=1 Tax=Thermus scotoductus TaxID=37636 RepID=A0A430RUG4_THESC|nr:class II fructose-bisphosphatase [Thermus scotoductus]RTG99210.1 fructose-bisphosphatase class II [Thermus scotoductus]RTH00463.1 fructose-bisphosphatase class II [Thermus scotoductus]RTH00807.1 fructose-bisphosphatase class II [Thermus scotoductus]RTH23339.1 fructose-bisphosphatase class II [Thermus scotoductus]RTH27443.1 fructose-bisphosphatase class II [Thermus scotoductus]
MPTRNLGLDLMRATEAAALASARHVGRGDKEAGDRAAVEAMRLLLNTLDFRGRVVIGEGEKDRAPMLYNGEVLGQGEGPLWDLAVDPVEGTRLLALGRPGAISVIAAAPEGALFNPGPGFYAAKLVVGPEAREAIDLRASVAENLRAIAKALRKEVRELTVFVLDKPRHARLIEEIRLAGARVTLQTDGDVAGALAAVLPDTGVDVLMGTGGTPEGVLAAVAVKALGGGMQMRLDPQGEEERWNLIHAGFDLDRVYTLDELCKAEDTHFAATGITDGPFLRGVRYGKGRAWTESLVIRGATGTLRKVEAWHRLEKLRGISPVAY